MSAFLRRSTAGCIASTAEYFSGFKLRRGAAEEIANCRKVCGAPNDAQLAAAGSSYASSGFGLVTLLNLIGAAIAAADMFYIQGKVVQPLLGLQRTTFRLLSGDATTRIPAEGVSRVVAVAEILEQVRVKLDGVMKNNLCAAETSSPMCGPRWMRSPTRPGVSARSSASSMASHSKVFQLSPRGQSSSRVRELSL